MKIILKEIAVREVAGGYEEQSRRDEIIIETQTGTIRE